MSLVRLMIGVLSHNNHLNVVDWCHFESIEDVFLLGIDLYDKVSYLPPRLVLILDELIDVLEGLGVHKLREWFFPALQVVLELIKRQEKVSLHKILYGFPISNPAVRLLLYIMEVGQLARLHAKKQELRGKREKLIQEELRKKRREKVNLDQSSVKKGYIEKQKIIAKKKFQTLVEKARKIPIELQENVNVNTFITHTNNFQKILERTKEKVKLNEELLRQGITAINSFGINSKEFVINFNLEFEKEIVCEPRPFLMYVFLKFSSIPEPQPCKQVIIVLPQVKEKDDHYPFQKTTGLNLSVMSHSEFIRKFNNDKIFTKKLFQQNIKCFVKWEQFKNNKFYEKLLRNGVPVFPIDSKKVPYALQETIKEYPQYIEFMSSHYLCVTKSGKEQIFRLKTGDVSSLLANVQVIIHSLVAKLIERSKNKQNKLVKVSLKTASSINFEVYHAQ